MNIICLFRDHKLERTQTQIDNVRLERIIVKQCQRKNCEEEETIIEDLSFT